MIDHLDPRRDLPQLLAMARDSSDPAPLLAAIAARDPVALAEVCCGPRAPGGPALALAALAHVGPLEKQLTPRGLYPRLADLAGPAAYDVLRVAAARHPAGSWLVALSRRVEGSTAGRIALGAAVGHPGFANACRLHAEAGHVDGLVLAAEDTGAAEPAAALLGVDEAAGLRAAAAALSTRPDAPVVAHLAAVYGPEPDELIRRLVPFLRSRAAADRLRADCRHLPRTLALLDSVLPGMAG